MIDSEKNSSLSEPGPDASTSSASGFIGNDIVDAIASSKLGENDPNLDNVEIATGETTPTGTSASKPSVGEFTWDSPELGRFWIGCFPPGTNVYQFDGLHPKALCSKICSSYAISKLVQYSYPNFPSCRSAHIIYELWSVRMGSSRKTLIAKLTGNDVLRTNININSGSNNPNDRLLCFEVLANLEAKFIEYGVVEAPQPK